MTHVEPPQPAAGLASSAVPPAPIAWPTGVTATACLTFDMDAEAPMLTEDISAISRMTPMSHQSYGPLVGVPRILALLDRHDIKATFFVPGYSAHRYPGVVRRIAEAGPAGRQRQPQMRELLQLTDRDRHPGSSAPLDYPGCMAGSALHTAV